MSGGAGLGDCRVEVEIRLLAAAEGRLGLAALFVVQPQHVEDLFDRVDLVARNNAVCLAKGTHDGERRLDHLRLHDLQPTDNRLSQYGACPIAERRADEESGKTAEKCAEEGTDHHEKHARSLTAERTGISAHQLAGRLHPDKPRRPWPAEPQCVEISCLHCIVAAAGVRALLRRNLVGVVV